MQKVSLPDPCKHSIPPLGHMVSRGHGFSSNSIGKPQAELKLASTLTTNREPLYSSWRILPGQICQAIWICFDGGSCDLMSTLFNLDFKRPGNMFPFHSNGSMGMVTPFHVARSKNCPESPRRDWSSMEQFTADCQSPAVDGRYYTSHPLSFWLYHLLVHPNHQVTSQGQMQVFLGGGKEATISTSKAELVQSPCVLGSKLPLCMDIKPCK